jgi:nitrate reductase NapE component
MTEVIGPGGDPGAIPGTAHPARALVPRRASGVELLGEMKGSGYRRPPALARRPDGQVVQLTPLLHAVLQAVDGERDIAEVARAASSTSGRTMTAANVETLLEKLRPMGLVVGADGAEPSGHRTNPLLALRMKVAVTDPQRTRALTAPFARLFHPIVVVAVVAPFGWICWWVLVERGLVRGADPHHRRGRPRSSGIPGGVPVRLAHRGRHRLRQARPERGRYAHARHGRYGRSDRHLVVRAHHGSVRAHH